MWQRASRYREHRGMDDTDDDLLSDIMAGVSDGRVRNPFDVLGQFIQDPNLNRFSTAFADLFQGLLVDNSPANPGLGPINPVSRSRFAQVAEGLSPAWSLDQPPSFDIRVSEAFMVCQNLSYPEIRSSHQIYFSLIEFMSFLLPH
jgi:hypothetical protein